jgi:hypothetical protein
MNPGAVFDVINDSSEDKGKGLFSNSNINAVKAGSRAWEEEERTRFGFDCTIV